MGRPSKYPAGFRREAVEPEKTSVRSQSDIARSLGMRNQTLANWVKADRDASERDADPTSLSLDELAELKRLRKDNASLLEGR